MGKIMYGEVASGGGLQGAVTVRDAYFILNHGIAQRSGKAYAFTSFVVEVENEDGEDKKLNYSYLPLVTQDGREIVGPSNDGITPAGEAKDPSSFGDTREIHYPHIASFDGEQRGVMGSTEFGVFVASLVNSGFDMEKVNDGWGSLKGAQLEMITTEFKSGNQTKSISKVDRFLGAEGGKGKKAAKKKESSADLDEVKAELIEAGMEILAETPKTARELSVALYVGQILKNTSLASADKTKLKTWVANNAAKWDGVEQDEDGTLSIG